MTAILYWIFIVLVFGFGVGIRLWALFLNRSLWLDEAALANNLFLENSILNNLQYNQAAPPLFKLFSAFNVHLLGVNELALRLLPFVCGILSLILFFFVLRKIFKSKFAQILAFALFSMNTCLVMYSSEFKQYSVDLLICLLILWCLMTIDFEKCKYRMILVFSVLVSILIWFSHFSLFMFPIILIWCCYATKFNAKKLAILIVPFVISFVVYWNLHLMEIYHHEALHAYWRVAFVNSFSSFLVILKNFFIEVFYPISRVLLLWILAVAGMILMFIKDKKSAFFVLVPIFFIFACSALQKYPLTPRLCLFFVPLAIILMVYPLDSFDFKKGKHGLVWGLLFVLGFMEYLTIYPSTVFDKKFYYKEEMRQMLERVVESASATDKIIVLKDGHQAFRFYKNYYKKSHKGGFDFDEKNVLEVPYNAKYSNYLSAPVIDLAKHEGIYWVLVVKKLSQVEFKRELEELEGHGVSRLKIYREDGYGNGYLLKLRK